MEKLVNCDIIIDIKHIESISGGDQYFEVLFSAKNKNKTKHKIIFDPVWDMRCSIENASIDRFCKFRENLTDDIIDNSIYIVKNSEYIKYFESQVSGTRPVDQLKHYILHDSIDTIIDVLSVERPILIRM